MSQGGKKTCFFNQTCTKKHTKKPPNNSTNQKSQILTSLLMRAEFSREFVQQHLIDKTLFWTLHCKFCKVNSKRKVSLRLCSSYETG